MTAPADISTDSAASGDRLALARRVTVVAYVSVFVWSVFTFGIPVDRIVVLSWMLGGFTAASIGRTREEVVQMVRDWLVLVAIYMAYDYSRGTADQWGIAVNYEGPRDADSFLLFGREPVSGLQRRFYDPTDVRWWDVTGSVIYMTHFVFPVVPLALLRVRDRPEWVRYVRRFSTTLFVAVACFIVYPAAPPWMASRDGYLPPVDRITGRGWAEVGLDTVNRTFDRGVAVLNPVAAMPSLHAGLSLLVALWFTRRSAPWVRAVAMLYPLSMAAALVYFGEHYVVDCLAGWAVVGVAMWASARWEERRSVTTRTG